MKPNQSKKATSNEHPSAKNTFIHKRKDSGWSLEDETLKSSENTESENLKRNNLENNLVAKRRVIHHKISDSSKSPAPVGGYGRERDLKKMDQGNGGPYGSQE
jgi:hypothetical protein